MSHIDPKFLVEVDEDDVQNVFAFELGAERIQTHPTEAVISLPLLIQSSQAFPHEIQHFIGNLAAALGKSLGIVTAPAVIFSRMQSPEPTLKFYAAYLVEILRQTLAFHQFPELEIAFSSHPKPPQFYLNRLGISLLTRYNPNSNWAGLHFPDDGSETSFARWSMAQMEKQSDNEDTLNVQLAKLVNLGVFRVVDVNRHYAFVWIDLRRVSSLAEDKIIGAMILKAVGAKNLPPLMEKSKTSHDSTHWSPWCIISFHHREGPVKLANFLFPGQEGNRLRLSRKHKLYLELGGSIVPFSNLILKAIKKTTEETALRNGNTKYLDRVFAYGSTLALTETQVYQSSDLEGLNFSTLTESLHDIGVHSFDLTGNRMDVLNDAASLFLSEEERRGRLFNQPTRQDVLKAKALYFERVKNFLQEFGRKTTAKKPTGRGLASIPTQRPVDSKERNPIILFLIDGLRPDRFKIAAQETVSPGRALIPNLKALFYDKGTEVESYTPRSLTLPSWSTILTGFESDMHGIRSNSPTSRKAHKITDNYLNPIKDLLLAQNWTKNRAFQRVEDDRTGEAEKVWLPGYFSSGQSFFNYLPLVNGATLPIIDVFRSFVDHKSERMNYSWFPATALDLASAKMTAEAIENDREGKLRLIMNWYAGVDEAQHYNNSYLPYVYQDVDKAVGMVLEAARKHPVLKKATVLMISDHGHSAGFGPFNESSTIYSAGDMRATPAHVNEGPLLINTGFNLTEFLSGNIPEFNYYHYHVGTPSTMESKPDLSWMTEFHLPSFSWIYSKGWTSPDALVDYAGSNLSQIYLKGARGWNHRPSFFELTHIPKTGPIKPGQSVTANLISDLMNYRMPNVRIMDANLARRVREISDLHPVKLVTLPLSGTDARVELDRLGARPETGSSTRNPVLVLSQGKTPAESKTSVILTRSDLEGRDWFRYLVLKNFDQDASGHITATVSTDPSDDPLQYLGTVPGAENPAAWRTDHEWLRLARLHPRPTAIFSLVRTATLAPKFTDSTLNQVPEKIRLERLAEIPDLILISNPGYAFHDSTPLESDHGGLMQEEVRNSFFISSLEGSKYSRRRMIQEPVLTRDYMPTLLELSFEGFRSISQALPVTQGDSFRALLE